jgi:hypothetical protein
LSSERVRVIALLRLAATVSRAGFAGIASAASAQPHPLFPCFPSFPLPLIRAELLPCSPVCVVAGSFGLRATVTAFPLIPLSPGLPCCCAAVLLLLLLLLESCHRGEGIPLPSASGDPRWRGRGVAGVTVPRQHPHRFYLQNRFQRNHDSPVTLLPDNAASLHPCYPTALHPLLRLISG